MAFITVPALLKALLVLLSVSFSSAQCPNTQAASNPNVRTTCLTGNFFILAVDKAEVEKAVAPYKLLALPTDDASLFPQGFPAGKHPVVVNSGYLNDIRQSALQLPEALMTGGISVPFTDRIGDGKTPFNFNVAGYVGGVDGQDISPLVPAIVGTLGGSTLHVAKFDPDNAASRQISDSPPEYISQIKKVIVPNPISGPGVILEAVDTRFSTTSESSYTARTFHNLINQPVILTNSLCQRNPIYFTETFSDPVFRKGTVTLYSPGGAFAGIYNDIDGYTASGGMIGYNAESCEDAAANNDPEASA